MGVFELQAIVILHVQSEKYLYAYYTHTYQRPKFPSVSLLDQTSLPCLAPRSRTQLNALPESCNSGLNIVGELADIFNFLKIMLI